MAANSKSSHVTKPARETGEAAIHEPTPFEMLIRDMAQVATADETEGKFSGDDLNAILSAETEEEMWDADNRPPYNFQHLAGCQIEILDFVVKYSRNADSTIQTPFIASDGRKMYLLCTVQRVDNSGEKKIIRLPAPGENFTANTSARYVVAKIWRAMQFGKIDPENGHRLRTIVEGIDLGGDQTVIKLRPPVAAPVTASAI